MKKIQYFACGIALFSLASCSNPADMSSDETLADAYEITNMVARGDGDGEMAIGNDNNGGAAKENFDAEAGTLTAGEWSDLNNWGFWQSLMQKEMFFEYQKQWKFYPTQRYSVRVTDKVGQPVLDCKVALLNKDKKELWTAKTNNAGIAELWAQPFSEEKDLNNTIVVDYNGTQQKIKHPETFIKGVNNVELPVTASAPGNNADVMFVVDATGSMEDEIAYLKKELADVVGQVKTKYPDLTLQIGSVFYRDKGDEYVTRSAALSADASATINFIDQQAADGGGDYPEAVDAALIDAVSQQNWSASAKTRIVFLMLDAPPHHDNASLTSLHNTIQKAAAKGIKIIPIASSGIDKDTEFLMRFMSMATNGSYVFMTDHSGVGNSHIEPTVGEYRVEYLNDLLTRMITQSLEPVSVLE